MISILNLQPLLLDETTNGFKYDFRNLSYEEETKRLEYCDLGCIKIAHAFVDKLIEVKMTTLAEVREDTIKPMSCEVIVMGSEESLVNVTDNNFHVASRENHLNLDDSSVVAWMSYGSVFEDIKPLFIIRSSCYDILKNVDNFFKTYIEEAISK